MYQVLYMHNSALNFFLKEWSVLFTLNMDIFKKMSLKYVQ